MNDRQDKRLGLCVQPYLLFVGPIDNINVYKVVVDSQYWDFDNPKTALDVAFKVMLATNSRYPPEARHVWTFIQQAVYDIFSPEDFKDDRPLKAFLAADLKEYKALLAKK